MTEPDPELLGAIQQDEQTPPVFEKKMLVLPTPPHLEPHCCRFTWALLAWTIALVVFIVGFAAVFQHGLWCPATLNNATQVRYGKLLGYANYTANPCTDFWNYACGTYTHTHLSNSVLEHLQTANLAEIAPLLQTLLANYTPTLDPSFNATALGWFADYTLEIDRDFQNPTRYAAYLTQATNDSSIQLQDYAVLLPTTPLTCPLPAPLQTLFQQYTDAVWYVYSTGAFCTENISMPVLPSPTAQILDFFPDAINAAVPPLPSGLPAFCESIRALVLHFLKDRACWMNPTTRAFAIEKIQNITFHIGNGSSAIPDCTAQSYTVCKEQAFAASLALLGTPASVSWSMTAIEANAYYDPLVNGVFLPAGIARQPLYDSDWPPTLQLAGLGTIIAHELAHAIDPMGLEFNIEGAVETGHAFNESTATCIVNTYNALGSPNASYTLNENFADLVSIATMDLYGFQDMWELSRRDVWTAWAQTWCQVSVHQSDQISHLDVHAASRYRVLGMASQSPAFYATFGCTEPLPPLCLL